MVKDCKNYKLTALQCLLEYWSAGYDVIETDYSFKSELFYSFESVLHIAKMDTAVIYTMSKNLNSFTSIKWHLPLLADSPFTYEILILCFI